MTEKDYILDRLKEGYEIRLVDGRVDNGYVDKDALNELVSRGVVEVFDNGGMRFVRHKEGT